MLASWYLRRAIPWVALLGCCAGATVLAGVIGHWPSTAAVLLPTLVGCCAGAAAFTFDEPALPVVEVTPRGATWRRTARLAAAGVPLLLWVVVVLVGPGDLPLARGRWLLIGLAATTLTAGLAALASRRGATAPGGPLAGGVVLAAIGPVVIAAFLDWDSLYPIGEFPSNVAVVWLSVAAAGVLACVAALRPGIGR
jgi:hypothetical protein